MKEVGELAVVAQEAVRQDLFCGGIPGSLEMFLEQELEELVGAEGYALVGNVAIGAAERIGGAC